MATHRDGGPGGVQRSPGSNPERGTIELQTRRSAVLFLLLVLIVGGGFFCAQYALFPFMSEFKPIPAFVDDVKKDLGPGVCRSTSHHDDG